MRKRRKSTPITKLQREAEFLWKKCCRLRDLLVFSGCMVEYHFPEENLTHTDTLQVDHCFTRTNKHLFLYVPNGTTVCSSCNGMKNWDKKSVGRLIDEIVIKREGKKEYERMKKIDLMGTPNKYWSNPAWLENKIKELEKLSIELTLKWAELKGEEKWK